MRLRKALLTGLATAALTTAMAAPAHATATETDTAAPRWHNTGQTFYWYDSCEAAGRAGVKSGWQTYDCKGSSAPWEDYELWGLW